MASKATTATAAETTTAEKSAAVKYTLEKMRQYSLKLFGVTSSTFAGATASLAPGEYTVDEVKETINKWKNKEAK